MRHGFHRGMDPREFFKGDERFHRGRGRGHGWGAAEWMEEWHQRRHHGRRRMLDASELRLILLKLIAEAPRHGYDLIQAVSDLTGGAYAPSPGVVYPALSLLEDQNQIAQAESEGTRKAFAITEAGTAELAANAEAVEELFARLGELAEMRERVDAMPVKRAMENLRNVLRAKLGRESGDKVHDIAAILDRTAQEIERLP